MLFTKRAKIYWRSKFILKEWRTDKEWNTGVVSGEFPEGKGDVHTSRPFFLSVSSFLSELDPLDDTEYFPVSESINNRN